MRKQMSEQESEQRSEVRGKMMEAIQECYVCKQWFDEKALSKINVPDQGAGHVEKPICSKCIQEIQERSHGRE